jgi:hypothetical protein
MEIMSTKTLLTQLHRKQIGVNVLTTDRISQLKKLLKNINTGRRTRALPSLLHCFDLWNFGKSVTKDLFVASKLRKCQTLGVWIHRVRNMLYLCFSACKVVVQETTSLMLFLNNELWKSAEIPS